jgi:hypothetical protein
MVVLVTLCSINGLSLFPFKTFASWRLCVRSFFWRLGEAQRKELAVVKEN